MLVYRVATGGACLLSFGGVLYHSKLVGAIMSDLMLLGSFLAGTFEFTLKSLKAVGSCFEIYFWCIIATLVVAVGIIFSKEG